MRQTKQRKPTWNSCGIQMRQREMIRRTDKEMRSVAKT